MYGIRYPYKHSVEMTHKEVIQLFNFLSKAGT